MKKPVKKNPEALAMDSVSRQVLDSMGEYGPTKHSSNASERARVRVMAQNGGDDASDSAIEDMAMETMNDTPDGAFMEMPAKEAFATLGLSKPSPALLQLWDSVDPAQRKGIVDAIMSNIAAPTDDVDSAIVRDAEYNLGGDPDDDNDGMGPTGQGYNPRAQMEQEILRKVGGK
jgi:hypothetical protein